MLAGGTNSFLAWFAEWGQVVYFLAQMLFWAALAVAAIIVALQYRRYVTFKVGDRTAPDTEKPAPDIFVE